MDIMTKIKNSMLNSHKEVKLSMRSDFEFFNSSKLYSLDMFKERYDKKLSKAYLEGRYGAIPIFQSFTYDKED
ncbi:MAG: hypothetical protein ACLRRH_07400 [Clostridium sp.]|jgi:hypothetical protein